MDEQQKRRADEETAPTARKGHPAVPAHKLEVREHAMNQTIQDIDLSFLDISAPFNSGDSLETDFMPQSAKLVRTVEKRRMIQATKREHMAEILDRLPNANEIFHIVANGKFDHFTFVPRIAELMGCVDVFYGSTWTMNRENAIELLGLYDNGTFKSVALLTGLYFKRRETSVYATILEGLQKRNQRFIAFENHAKVSLFADEAAQVYIVVEGSANYTSNPRLENFTVTNDKGVYDLHKGWMEEVLNVRH
jgi:hypothetical protein